MEKKKATWYLILLLNIFIFIIALRTNVLLFNLLSISLSIIIYKYGSPIMFKEYNEKKKAKELELEKIKFANKEIILNLHKKSRGTK